MLIWFLSAICSAIHAIAVLPRAAGRARGGRTTTPITGADRRTVGSVSSSGTPHRADIRDFLATRRDAFRGRWGAHDVRNHGTGLKHFNHPIVGAIDLAYDSLDVRSTGDERIVLNGYTAAPGTAADEKLRMLASWAATAPDMRTGERPGRLT